MNTGFGSRQPTPFHVFSKPFISKWWEISLFFPSEPPQLGWPLFTKAATGSRAGKQGSQRKDEKKKRTQKESCYSLLEMLCCTLGRKCKYHQELGIKRSDSADCTVTPVALKGQFCGAGTQSPHTLIPGRAHTVTPDPSKITISSSQQLWQWIAPQSFILRTKNPKKTNKPPDAT